MHALCLVNRPPNPCRQQGSLRFGFFSVTNDAAMNVLAPLHMCVSDCLGQIPESRHARSKGDKVHNLTDLAMSNAHPTLCA